MNPPEGPSCHAIRAGARAYGFDGAELGRVVRVSARQQQLQLLDEGRTLLLPLSFVGLVAADFVILRGTASALRARGAERLAPLPPGSRTTVLGAPRKPVYRGRLRPSAVEA
jgi:hypothetical protein